MPDKHEVGGSTPLEPTKHTQVCGDQKEKREVPNAYTKYKRKTGARLDST